jgi:hypothetical protein
MSVVAWGVADSPRKYEARVGRGRYDMIAPGVAAKLAGEGYQEYLSRPICAAQLCKERKQARIKKKVQVSLIP